jgi:hypothetical protein
MLDDTCYFLPRDSAQQAALVVSLLNDPISLRFISALMFEDAKRPITKKVLQRMSLCAILRAVSRGRLMANVDRELENLRMGLGGGALEFHDPLEDLLSARSTGASAEGR